MDARPRGRGVRRDDAALILLEKAENSSRRVCSLIGGGGNTFKEKGKPLLPRMPVLLQIVATTP
jgi:hypothetical protein